MKLADRSDLKLQNRKTVYNYIRSSVDKTVSSAQISRDTRISLPTVLKITSFFESRKMLEILGTQESGSVGRRPTLLKFVPDNYYSVGVSYDSKYLELVLINLDYEVVFSDKIRVLTSVKNLLKNELYNYINVFLDKSGCSKKLISIGIALPIIFDIKNFRTTFSAPLMDIDKDHDFKPYKSALEKKFNCLVFFENDVNAAAFAEFKQRGYGSRDDLVYITIGVGVGCGIMLNGELRYGSNFAAGEIGSMLMHSTPKGENGNPFILETALGPKMLESLFGYNVFDDGSPGIQENFIRMADYIAQRLAFAISNLSTILDLNNFVLGGFVIEPIKEYVLRYTLSYLKDKRHIDVSAVSSNWVTAQGAAAVSGDIALDDILLED